MWFGMGMGELALVGVMLLLALALALLRRQAWRSAAITAGLFLLAALLTPADLVSQLALGALLLAVFTAGQQIMRLSKPQPR